jgi:trigger factor
LLPEIDDNFASNVAPEVGSLADLRKRILQDLQQEEESKHKQDVQEKIIDKIIEKNDFEVPEAMVENYLTSIVEEDRRRRPNVESEDGRDTQVREMFREPATRMVRRYLIMEAVARQEKLAVTRDEFDKRVEYLAEGAGRPVEEVAAMFRDKKHRRNLENELLDQKVLDFLRENAEIKVD